MAAEWEGASKTAAEEAVRRILADEAFAKAGRLRDLLPYLVEKAAAGEPIKELTLAVDVFQRDGHDPKTDSVVRVTTSKLRSKLEAYYAGPGQGDPVRIELPKGSYTPVVTVRAEKRKSVDRRVLRIVGGAVVAACLGLAAAAVMVFRAEPAVSIAVLPFVDMTAEGDLGYFCDGLAEELIDSLAKVPGLDVVGRTSAFAYKGKPYDVRRIGDELGVTRIFEGSVRRSGEQLRVSAQLADARSGRPVWSRTYEIRMADLFATQDEIVRAILTAVNPGRAAGAVSEPPRNLDAWRHYVRGRQLALRRKAGAGEEAIAAFEQALAIDATFAPAHAEIARVILNQGLAGPLSPAETMERGRKSITEALRLDPGLGEAHAWRGRLLSSYDWDWEGALAAHRRSVELSPGSSTVHALQGVTLYFLGKPESVPALRRAIKLDPLSPGARNHLGAAFYFLRRHEEAIRHARADIDSRPDDPRSYIALALAHTALQQYEPAVAAAEKGASLDKDPTNVGWLGLIAHPYAAWGKREKALELLRRIEEAGKTQYVSPMIYARVYMGLGDTERAFAYLERGMRQRDGLMPWLKCDARFDAIRGDPRYVAMLRQLRME